MKRYLYLAAIVVWAMIPASCDNYLDIEPEGKVIPKTLEENRALLTKAYSGYPKHRSKLQFRTDEVILDEFSNDAPYFRDIYIWKDVNPDPQTGQYPWVQFYNTVFYTNHIINEGVLTMKDSAEKDQLLGEAYALRAYSFFDLVNLYGKPYNKETSANDPGVPLALEIDLEQVFKPASVGEVYAQVLSDLENAKELINVELQETGKNYRFSISAVNALEARVYLYMNDWENAVSAVNRSLNYNDQLLNMNTAAGLPNEYTSPESVLALEDVYEASVNNAAFISNELIALFDQENDLRFSLYFVQSGGNYKSNKGGDQKYKCSIRTAELYLLKAEALFHLGNINEAKETLLSLLENRYDPAYINTLQAGIEAMNSTDFEAMLQQERARELALEGHRWFDLRRSNQKEIVHSFDGETYILAENDPRYTLLYPEDAKLNNPEL